MDLTHEPTGKKTNPLPLIQADQSDVLLLAERPDASSFHLRSVPPVELTGFHSSHCMFTLDAETRKQEGWRARYQDCARSSVEIWLMIWYNVSIREIPIAYVSNNNLAPPPPVSLTSGRECWPAVTGFVPAPRGAATLTGIGCDGWVSAAGPAPPAWTKTPAAAPCHAHPLPVSNDTHTHTQKHFTHMWMKFRINRQYKSPKFILIQITNKNKQLP